MLGLLLAWGLVSFAGPQAHAQAGSRAEVALYLAEMRQLAEEALAASRAAEEATSVEALKQYADEVYETAWGAPSGLPVGQPRGEAALHGWKTQWQVTPAAFDSAFAARYGVDPPEIDDPQRLGIMGRGRHVRTLLEGNFYREGAQDLRDVNLETVGRIVTPLNNFIGWMKMDDGVTKGERQPRVDLTREWDAPSAFWLSTADTGWLPEAYSQALNILKTDYEGDLAMARRHAAAMTELLERALRGEDLDGDGEVEPVMMEGGLYTALDQAERAGLL